METKTTRKIGDPPLVAKRRINGMSYHNMQHTRILTLLCSILLFWGMNPGWAQPIVDLGADTTLCGGTLTLDAGSPGSTYSWSTGASSQTIQVSASGVYWVDVTDGGGTARDSITVFILTTPAPPLTSDITVCKADETEVTAQGTGDQILWFADAAGNDIVGFGDTLAIGIDDTTTFYAQAINTTPVIANGLSSPTNFVYANNVRGLRIVTEKDLIFHSTTVHVNQPTSFDVEILNQSLGNLSVFQKTVTLNAAGAHEIPLFVPLEGGYTYRILASNISGQLATSNVGLAYPYDFPDLMQIVGDQNGSQSFYRYFYNIKVSAGLCVSPASPLTINILPSPVLDLGPDTVLCGGVLNLDVANTNASYLWSTGSTNPNITVSASDTVSVLVTIGICQATDSIQVQIIDVPADPILADTTLCKDEFVLLQANSPSSRVLWYADSLGQEIISMDNPFNYPLTDSTTIYMQAVNTPQVLQGGIATPGNLIYNASPRGLSFEVFRNLILESVTVYSDQPTDFDLTITTKSGTQIKSIPVSLSDAGQHVIPLFVSLAPDEYRILGENINGALANTTVGLNYPFITGDFLSISGDQNNNTSLYRYFFDFKFFQAYCASSIQPLDINVLQTPEVDLGPDTVLCGSTPFTLDASYPGASYLWSTNETTSSIQTDTTGTYTVTATINTCSTTSTRSLLFIDEPVLPVTQDTTICAPGPITLTAQSLANRLFWYAEPIGGKLLDVDSLRISITDTSTYYVSTGSSSLISNVGFSVNFNNNMNTSYRGLLFDVNAPSIILHEVEVVVGSPADFKVVVVDESSNEVVSASFQNLQPIQDGGSNFLPQKIPLYFKIPEGKNYRIFADITQGELGNFTSNLVYPYEIPGLVKIVSASNQSLSNYYYFYNWRVSRGICYSPRVPLNVNVEIPLNLPSYVYACDDTVIDAGNVVGSYLWNTGETTPIIVADSTGDYILEVDNGLGCLAVDTTFVEIPINAGLADDGILCGNTLTTNYDETAEFLWSNGDTTASLEISNPGTYSVVVNEPRGCTVYDTIVVTGFDSFPVADLGPDLIACDSVLLSANSPGNNYQWSSGETTEDITVFSSGTYTVMVTNSNNCVTRDTIGVAVTPSPEAKFSVPDTVVNANLQVTFVNQSSFGAFNWDFGDGNGSSVASPKHTYADTGTYCVTLIMNDIQSNCGSDTLEKCFTLLEYNVGLEDLYELKLKAYPNPARDQFQLELPSEGLLNPTIRIYNPAGQLIYVENLSGPVNDEVNINSQRWTNGLYLIQVTDGHGQRGQIKILKY
jgi:hypothetical protein